MRKREGAGGWRGAGLVALAGACVVFVGCQTPSIPETIESIDQNREAIEKWHEEAKKNCNGDAECEAAVRAVYLDLIQQAFELRQEVLTSDWEDARERRKNLEDTIRGLIPQWPDLEELLEPLLRSGTLEAEGLITGTPETTQSFGPGTPPTTYSLDGDFTLYNTGLGNPTVGISGSLTMPGAPAAPGQSRVFSGGTVVLNLPGSYHFDATLHAPAPGAGLQSWIETDSSGNGWLRLVLAFDDDDLVDSWGALLSSPTAIRLPVTIDGQGVFEFDKSQGEIGDWYPYEQWAASDYDDDGSLDSDLDSAAFMSGFQAQEALADVDNDGSWTIDDIELWWAHFWTDFSEQ